MKNSDMSQKKIEEILSEKMLISVSPETMTSLKKDAMQFEFYKGKGPYVNMNGFLSRLLVGYYDMYEQERAYKIAQIESIADSCLIDSKKTKEISVRLLDEVFLPYIPGRKGNRSERLALKATRETREIIAAIIKKTEGSKDSRSRYLCRLLTCYCEKPFYERERIVFRKKAEFLQRACKERNEIWLTVNTTPDVDLCVVPYQMAVHAEEMNNYLLCQCYSKDRKKYEVRSFRLCRIVAAGFTGKLGTLDSEIEKKLEKTKKYGPPWAINEDKEICVRLTSAGQDSYRQIYNGRPGVDRVDKLDNGNAMYYFSASEDQLFRYIIHFNAGEAEIISPPSLRARIRQHFRESAALYEQT